MQVALMYFTAREIAKLLEKRKHERKAEELLRKRRREQLKAATLINQGFNSSMFIALANGSQGTLYFDPNNGTYHLHTKEGLIYDVWKIADADEHGPEEFIIKPIRSGLDGLQLTIDHNGILHSAQMPEPTPQDKEMFRKVADRIGL